MDPSFDHLLFPTDFSKNAEKALLFAAEMAQRSEAELTIFHASQGTMDLTADYEHHKQDVIQQAEKEFDKLIAKLKKKGSYGELKISTVLQSGDPVSALFEQAGGNDIDLIVMGTKGATGDRNELFGSVTTSVIKKTKIPVMAVPYESRFDEFENIAFTTDYKEGDLNSFEKVVTLARQFDSSINVLHVADQQSLEAEIKFRGFRDLIKSRTDYPKIEFCIEYEFDFFTGVAEYLYERPTSLFALTKYKKTFWEKLVERNHAKEMAFYSRVPILVLIGEENPEENVIINSSQ